MEYALVGLLLLFLVFIFVEIRRKSQRVQRAVIEEKRSIAEDSGMTAYIGVFSPDVQTTVIIGVAEELGVFYYRMMKQATVKVRSRINLANLGRIDFLVNSNVYPIGLESQQPTTSLKATEIADRVISQYSTDSIRQIDKAAMRVNFYDDSRQEKSLEITTLRSGDERQRFERVPLLKNTIWWVAFLQLAARLARNTRSKLEREEP